MRYPSERRIKKEKKKQAVIDMVFLIGCMSFIYILTLLFA